MPYIQQHRKEHLEKADDPKPKGPGELNFVFTWFALDYIERYGESYQIINDVIGALESAKLEFYRRLVVPYEDKKIEENGDVY